MPATAAGEGMSGSPDQDLPTRRNTGTDERTTRIHLEPQEPEHQLFSAAQIVRPAAPASRPSGRYAVGLRPSLDPDASARRAHTATGEDQNNGQDPLTGPA